jgi:hypothetical protein
MGPRRYDKHRSVDALVSFHQGPSGLPMCRTSGVVTAYSCVESKAFFPDPLTSNSTPTVALTSSLSAPRRAGAKDLPAVRVQEDTQSLSRCGPRPRCPANALLDARQSADIIEGINAFTGAIRSLMKLLGEVTNVHTTVNRLPLCRIAVGTDPQSRSGRFSV